MHVLIVDAAPDRQEAYQLALLEAGIFATGGGSLAVAEACLRRMAVDGLIIERRSAGTQLPALLKMAEARNPNVSSLLLTPDVPGDANLLQGRIASLHGIVDISIRPELALRLVRSGMSAGFGREDHVAMPGLDAPLFQSSRAASVDIAA